MTPNGAKVVAYLKDRKKWNAQVCRGYAAKLRFHYFDEEAALACEAIAKERPERFPEDDDLPGQPEPEPEPEPKES